MVRGVSQHRYPGREPTCRRVPNRQVQPRQPCFCRHAFFAEADAFVPFDKELGYCVVEALEEVAGRHDADPAVLRSLGDGTVGRQQCDRCCPEARAIWKTTSLPWTFGSRTTTSGF